MWQFIIFSADIVSSLDIQLEKSENDNPAVKNLLKVAKYD